MKLVFTAEARRDLLGIGDTIAMDNPRRAETFVDELEAHCQRIADFPLKHPLLPGHEQSGVRRVVHGNYLIFYRIAGELAEVLRVLHGARSYEEILFPVE